MVASQVRCGFWGEAKTLWHPCRDSMVRTVPVVHQPFCHVRRLPVFLPAFPWYGLPKQHAPTGDCVLWALRLAQNECLHGGGGGGLQTVFVTDTCCTLHLGTRTPFLCRTTAYPQTQAPKRDWEFHGCVCIHTY